MLSDAAQFGRCGRRAAYGLTNGRETGAYKVLVNPKDWRSGFISRADVADFMVKQIDNDTFLKKTPVLLG
jgi:hypothetical protein